jgi:archaellum component FlaF (FlaF/FlaG flagellin family)
MTRLLQMNAGRASRGPRPFALTALALALAGCGGSQASTSTPASTTPAAAPAPVSTTATLTSTCTMGYEEDQPDINGYASGQYGAFSTQGGGANIGGNHYAPALAFQMTLSNPGSATANVDTIAIVFFDTSGTEQGSVTAPATGYIVPGQSLTWTVRSPLATDGSGTGSNGDQANSTIPLTAASCSLVSWYMP